MAKAKLTSEEIARLCQAMQLSRLALQRPRQNRVAAVKDYAGPNWSEETAGKEQPCNLVGAYCSIVGRKLIANNPRVMLSTGVGAVKPVVSAMEAWANEEIERIDLAGTFQRVVLDALFSIGVCKVGLATAGDAAALAWNILPGQPFCIPIDLDDLVADMHARDPSQFSFIGHRYRMPLKVARKQFGQRDIGASEDTLFNLEGDERINVLGRTTYATGDHSEYELMVDLWEVFLPRERLVVTLLEEQLPGAFGNDAKYSPTFGKALDIRPWLGPACGPYHILAFGVVPGHWLPKAPIHDLIDLHRDVNELLRKLIRQAKRQKGTFAVRGAVMESAKEMSRTNDGEMFACEDPQGIQAIMTGGPSAENYQLFGALRELFSWLAGNLELMGGLAPQSKTFGQDKMLEESASGTVADMQDKTVRLAASVVNALCWFWHHDPYRVMKTTHSLPGVGLSMEMQVHPWTGAAPGKMARTHSYEDMKVRVDPYALQHQTPQQRMAALDELVMQVLTPLASVLQQAGYTFDVEAYLRKKAKYMDSPDLPEIVTMQEPPTEDGGGPPESPGMPAQTTRNYNRRSTGGATTAGSDLQRANAMRVAPQQNGQPQAIGA